MKCYVKYFELIFAGFLCGSSCINISILVVRFSANCFTDSVVDALTE